MSNLTISANPYNKSFDNLVLAVHFKKFFLLIILIFYPELYETENSESIKSMILSNYKNVFRLMRLVEDPVINILINQANDILDPKESSTALMYGGSKRKTKTKQNQKVQRKTKHHKQNKKK